jgi:hypothetical protein
LNYGIGSTLLVMHPLMALLLPHLRPPLLLLHLPVAGG